jgi:hypothetical protein
METESHDDMLVCFPGNLTYIPIKSPDYSLINLTF